MEGPQKVKSPQVGLIQALSHPLGFGFVHEAQGTVTLRAGIAAGIAADAGLDEFIEIFPTTFRIQGFDGSDIGVPIHPDLFRDRVSQ